VSPFESTLEAALAARLVVRREAERRRPRQVRVAAQNLVGGVAVAAGPRLRGVRERQPRRVNDAVAPHQRHRNLPNQNVKLISDSRNAIKK